VVTNRRKFDMVTNRRKFDVVMNRNKFDVATDRRKFDVVTNCRKFDAVTNRCKLGVFTPQKIRFLLSVSGRVGFSGLHCLLTNSIFLVFPVIIHSRFLDDNSVK
jgi:hypothetical protein